MLFLCLGCCITFKGIFNRVCLRPVMKTVLGHSCGYLFSNSRNISVSGENICRLSTCLLELLASKA